MNEHEFSFDTRHLLQIALVLWVGYFAAIGLIDWGFGTSESLQIFLFYALQGVIGLVVIGSALLTPQSQRWSKKVTFIVLILMMALPTLMVHIGLRIFSSALLPSSEAISLRLTPIMLISILLMAWEFRWRHVILLCFAFAFLNLMGIYWMPRLPRILPPPSQAVLQIVPPPPPAPPRIDGMLTTTVQTISFLLVGYITSTLIERLRAQQRSLSAANQLLRNQASTREELAISQERNRMARELHDTLAHTLSGLTVQLQTVKAYWNVDPVTAQSALDTSLETSRAGLQETRGALKSLRAAPLDDLGLALAIRHHAEAVAERANLDLQLRIEEPLPPLAPNVTHCLYRVAQEAITNVVYHANANTLSVVLNTDGGGTWLIVADDGVGFDPETERPNHWGIRGLYERAKLIGGQLEINSTMNSGTTIQLMIPEKIA